MSAFDNVTHANAAQFAAARLSAIAEIATQLRELTADEPVTPNEFLTAVRNRDPKIKELASDHPDKLAWPDNCGAWLSAAFACFEGAVAALQAGDRTNYAFHSAEGSYCLMQASSCLELGF